MAKVIYRSLSGKLAPKAAAKSKREMPGSVTKKKIRTAAGGVTVIYKVDADSRTLGTDIGFAFVQNVKRARRANNQVILSASRARAKA